MQMSKHILFPMLGILFTGLLLFTVLVMSADYSTQICPEDRCYFQGGHIPVSELLVSENSTYVLDSIGAEKYIFNAALCDIPVMRKDIHALDSLFGESKTGRDTYIDLLTTQLLKRVESGTSVHNIDSLTALAQWVVRLDCLKETDPEYGRVFKVVYRYWMNYISNKLGQYFEEDNSIKYNFKFRYLCALCQSKKFSPPVGNSKMEKLTQYLTENQWVYIFNRFWYGTGVSAKLLAITVALLTLYGYICIFLLHFKYKSDA
jgi:hypothetical protein